MDRRGWRQVRAGRLVLAALLSGASKQCRAWALTLGAPQRQPDGDNAATTPAPRGLPASAHSPHTCPPNPRLTGSTPEPANQLGPELGPPPAQSTSLPSNLPQSDTAGPPALPSRHGVRGHPQGPAERAPTLSRGWQCPQRGRGTLPPSSSYAFKRTHPTLGPLPPCFSCQSLPLDRQLPLCWQLGCACVCVCVCVSICAHEVTGAQR